MITIRQANTNDAGAVRDLLSHLAYTFTAEAVQDRLTFSQRRAPIPYCLPFRTE
jgi:hypothetical protein